MTYKEQIFRINVGFLKSQYKVWLETHPKNLSLFQIIEYGEFEPIHTKFLNWLLQPSYHKKTYKDNYVREFLKSNKINTNLNDKIIVNSEKFSSIPFEDEHEQQRRVDICIEIDRGKSKQTVIIENKINDELKENQVIQEMEQYLKNERGGIYIALLLNSNIYKILKKHPDVIKTQKKYNIDFKLFTYQQWLNLNKEFFKHSKNDDKENEYRKIIHLNENIKELIKMNEIEKFDENFKIYLNSWKAIEDYKNKFEKQIDKFVKYLISKYPQLFKNAKASYNPHGGIYFKIGKYETELWCSADNLHDNLIAFAVKIPLDNNRDKILIKIDKIKNMKRGSSVKSGSGKNEWIYFNANPYDINELEKRITEIIEEMKKTLF